MRAPSLTCVLVLALVLLQLQLYILKGCALNGQQHLHHFLSCQVIMRRQAPPAKISLNASDCMFTIQGRPAKRNFDREKFACKKIRSARQDSETQLCT